MLAEIYTDILLDDRDEMKRRILEGDTIPSLDNLTPKQLIDEAEMIKECLAETNPEVDVFLMKHEDELFVLEGNPDRINELAEATKTNDKVLNFPLPRKRDSNGKFIKN